MDYLDFLGIRHDAELYHHGIKGQKWGVRRYQNEDGSLTSAGKSRYGSGTGTARILTQRVRSVNKMNKKLAKIDKEVERYKNSEYGKREQREAPEDYEYSIKKANENRRRAELTNEYRQKVLDVKASKTTGGRVVNYLLGGFGGNLAISSMELNNNTRGMALGKAYAANVLGNFTGIGPAVNAIIYTSNRDKYIYDRMKEDDK